jgi:hypothetical protein
MNMKTQQATKKITKSIGRRTYTLKELAQRDFGVVPKESIQNNAPIFNLVNIQEDLLEEDINQQDIPKKHEPQVKEVNADRVDMQEQLALPIALFNQLIKKEITKTANTLDLEEAELEAWIDLQVMAPRQTLLALLRIAKEHQLDPLKEEVALALYEDTHWQAYITVEGYSKILNHHPAFDGIAFTQSEELTNGIPHWMECTIYRKDRSQPIVVREYFEEVKGEQTIWQKMPRRMLRHRVMAQCARLAVGR